MSIEYKGLEELDRRFASAMRDRPELRLQMHIEVSKELQYEVLDQIDRVGIRQSGDKIGNANRPTGGLRDWQSRYVGSGGGYAAVRPIGKADGGGTGRNSAGAITNYLERGHKVRRPSGKAKRQRKSRGRYGYARGYYFYTAARSRAQQVAIAAANAYAQRMLERIGD
ncbi:MAG: hypothetical protein FWG88_05055 [Oscillospiraceae bacterium]|nr:hypothetical protein [Oscillospiraceae bacterium]